MTKKEKEKEEMRERKELEWSVLKINNQTLKLRYGTQLMDKYWPLKRKAAYG